MRKHHLITGVAAVLLLGACGSDKGPTDGGDDGIGGTSFTANVTGGITLSMSGSAYYGDGQDGTTEGGFGVALGALDENASSNIALVRNLGGRAPVGTYPIFDFSTDASPEDAEFAVYASLSSNGARQICRSRTGSLEITASAGEWVEGKFGSHLFCLPMLDPSSTDTLDVTVAGTFKARKAVVPLPND
jgi:hypothetical protein